MNESQKKILKYLDLWGNTSRFDGTAMIYQKNTAPIIKSYGFADVLHHVKNNHETIYHVGSFTKLFTAVSIMILYEQGKIKLDDRLSMYIDEFQHANNMTIHQLLTHTSGIPDHTQDALYDPNEIMTYEMMMDRINNKELHFMPGEAYAYSNTNYVILARMIEKLSKMDIETFYKQHIFHVLGLNSTGVTKSSELMERFAKGYTYSGEGRIPSKTFHMSGAYGSGFLYSNAHDVYTFITALLKHEIISKESLDILLKPYHYIWYLNAHAGYGCTILNTEGSQMSSNGLIYGYTFQLWADVKNERGIILLSNNDTTAIGRMTEGIIQILNNLEPKHERFEDDVINDVASDLLKAIAGSYRCQHTGAMFHITYHMDKLYVDQLWAQTYQEKLFELVCVYKSTNKYIFILPDCEGSFEFTFDDIGCITHASYTYDLFTLPYEKI